MSTVLEHRPDRITSSTRQTELHQQLVGSIDALGAAVEAIVRPLDPHRRTRPGAGAGWSIDRILEHLCLAGDDYMAEMRTALAEPGAMLRDGRWRPTVSGRLLVWSMTSHWKIPAPRRIVPVEVPRPAVLEAFLERNAALRDLLATAAAREWRLVSLTSPYARLVRLNFGDAARVVVRHAERHARQMARIAASR